MEKEYLKAHYGMLATLLEEAHKTCLKVLKKDSNEEMLDYINTGMKYPLIVEIEGYHYTMAFKNDDPEVKFSIKAVEYKKKGE